MAEAWVLDASPFILFARIGRLDILRDISPSIIIPTAVIREVRSGISNDPTANAALDWGMPLACDDVTLPASVASWDLGTGESQVIAQCAGNVRWAVLDDRMGRRCAAAHDVPVIGSLGIILRAKKSGLIDVAGYWVDQLRTHGMYMTDELVKQVLSAIGE